MLGDRDGLFFHHLRVGRSGSQLIRAGSALVHGARLSARDGRLVELRLDSFGV
jgi:hypothetical protein